MTFGKIEHDNCFIIQQIVNEAHYIARQNVTRRALQDVGRILANFVYRRISLMYK